MTSASFNQIALTFLKSSSLNELTTFLKFKLQTSKLKELEPQNEIIWSYNWGGRSKSNFARKHEYAWCWSKGENFLFNSDNVSEMDHISLSRWADLILLAPATANTISKISFGLSDDLASTVVFASDKKIFIAPAMNVRMWEHPSNKKNIK